MEYCNHILDPYTWASEMFWNEQRKLNNMHMCYLNRSIMFDIVPDCSEIS